MATCLYGARVLTPTSVLEQGTVVVGNDGRIAYVGAQDSAPRVDGLHLDLRGRILAPGFIDIHQQGGNRISFTLAPDRLGEAQEVL
ncbi:unnamed protein product, partial [marine sediment metagenome]